jgi:hypothetical protein
MLEIVLASCKFRTSLFPFHVRTTRHAFGLCACASFPSSNTLTAYSCTSSTSAHIARLARIFFVTPNMRVFLLRRHLKKYRQTMTASRGKGRPVRERGELAHGRADEECIICLELDPTPIQSGCACRSDSGLAHIDCRMSSAAALQRRDRGTKSVVGSARSANSRSQGRCERGSRRHGGRGFMNRRR